jgi:hypothetical protein
MISPSEGETPPVGSEKLPSDGERLPQWGVERSPHMGRDSPCGELDDLPLWGKTPPVRSEMIPSGGERLPRWGVQ